MAHSKPLSQITVATNFCKLGVLLRMCSFGRSLAATDFTCIISSLWNIRVSFVHVPQFSAELKVNGDIVVFQFDMHCIEMLYTFLNMGSS